MNRIVMALPILGMVACSGNQCDRVEAAADACHLEFESQDTGAPGEFEGEATCEGNLQKSVADCMVEAYDNADCTTFGGVLDAKSTANSCILTSGIFGQAFDGAF